jgi:signal peptidase I
MPEETTGSGDRAGESDAAEEPIDASTSAADSASAEPADAADRRTRTLTAEGDGDGGSDEPPSDVKKSDNGASSGDSVARQTGRFIALVASALLRAFVVQAFFVPSGSMLPTIQLNDRILVSRIGDVQRGEVVVFEDPGGWIPADEQAAPPGDVRKFFEFVGVLPASGHEHLVKRVIGLPGDHVVCCEGGQLVINGERVDESEFLKVGKQPADNVKFDVVVPKDHIFVLGDNRYVSGDSSRHLDGQDAFIPTDLVTGRAFAVIWPFDHRKILHIPDAYDDVPDGQTPPDQGVVKTTSGQSD